LSALPLPCLRIFLFAIQPALPPMPANSAAMRAAAALFAVVAGTLSPITAAGPSTITNGVITAELGPSCTLTSIATAAATVRGIEGGSSATQTQRQQAVVEAGWSLEVGGVEHSAVALHSSLALSKPSPSEVLCTWTSEPDHDDAEDAQTTGGKAGLTFTVRYSAPAGQAFVQKALNVSCGSDGCAIGRVTPVTGLEVGSSSALDASSSPPQVHFSLDAGGVFIRQNVSSAGLMVVVQNKHMELNAPAAGGGGGSKLKWTEHKDMGYTCSASEYKGTVDPHSWHNNHTAAGCLADAIAMGQGINYATTPGPVNCFLCAVTDAASKLHALPGQTTFIGVDPSAPNHTAATTTSLSYAAGLTAHPMKVPAPFPFEADLALFAPYEQTVETVPWPASAGGTGLQQVEYETFWRTVSPTHHLSACDDRLATVITMPLCP
jgi:hypothetical protein